MSSKFTILFFTILMTSSLMTSSLMETLLGEEGEKILVQGWIVSVSPRVASYNCETFYHA